LQLQYGLRSGTFTLILDGFDEVKSDFRDCIEKEILGISQTYPSCALLVSARPSSIFDSWTDFFCAEVAPLSSKAVSTLIKKLDFDLSVKQKFLDRVSDLYLSHKEFLSNPLLATMMLLTFDQYAEIPSKIHIFYEQAFQTLFNKHDALKSAFVRQSYSHLSIDDFRRYFSAFAFATYLDQVFSFDQNLLYTYVVKAKLLESIKVDEILYIKDLLESVCLLVKDGGVISFSHRSFQEYFSALYLTTANGVGIKELVTLILQRRMHDNVIDLAFDINRELLESKYIIPTMDEFISKSKKININKNCSAFFNLLFGSMSITNNKEFRIGFTISNSKFSLLLVNLHVWYRLYWEQELVDIGDKYDEDATIEIIKKFRANAEDWLTLTKVDDIWLEKTLIPDRLNRHYRVMSRLLSDLKSNHANKKKLLSEMLLDMKKESLKS
jgi:hypothetical protein